MSDFRVLYNVGTFLHPVFKYKDVYYAGSCSGTFDEVSECMLNDKNHYAPEDVTLLQKLDNDNYTEDLSRLTNNEDMVYLIALHNHVDLVKYLMGMCERINVLPILDMCFRYNHIELIDFFISKVDIDESGVRLAKVACKHNRRNLLTYLEEHGVDIEFHKDELLKKAVRYNSKDIIKYFNRDLTIWDKVKRIYKTILR